jgi:hypothetical protein
MEITFGFPHYQLHRFDVLETLARALPSERLHVGHRFAAVVDDGARVVVEFENGRGISTDALVGADGIHSAVRCAVFGPENPHFTVLRRLPRPDTGRSSNPSRSGGDSAGLDGARQTLRSLLRAESAARELRCHHGKGSLDTRILDGPG